MSATLFIISAPSGAGKTSLVKALLERMQGIKVSVSHTTRAMRPGEENGKDYHFTEIDAMKGMIDAGEFLESAQVFDNFYGTAKQTVEDDLATGTDVILEIDWQGAAQVREKMPGTVSIFILPPSRSALEDRLRGRGQDGEDIIARRMRDAESEMSHYGEFDYLVINDDFDTALNELVTLVNAQRLSLANQSARHADMLAELLPA